MQPLTPAEYALVFRTKAKNGRFTENLALHAPRQEYGGVIRPDISQVTW
jgi:hypothetical protein